MTKDLETLKEALRCVNETSSLKVRLDLMEALVSLNIDEIQTEKDLVFFIDRVEAELLYFYKITLDTKEKLEKKLLQLRNREIKLLNE